MAYAVCDYGNHLPVDKYRVTIPVKDMATKADRPRRAVMNFALLAGGCSIRLLLRTAAGEALGFVGFSGMVAGIIIGTLWLRWRATR